MIQQDLPLLPIQRRLWFLQQVELYGHDDIISLVYQTPAELTQEQVQGRLDHLIEHYDTLRVTLREHGDAVVQRIVTHSEARGIYTVNTAASNDLQTHMETARQALSDQGQAALFRVDLLCVPDECNTLLLTAHRMICDLDSLEYIAAHLLSASPNGAHPTTDFATYLTTNGFDNPTNLNKWVQTLSDAIHVCELPLDKTRPTIQQGHTANYQAEVTTLTHINNLAQQYHVTPATVCMAVYFTLLYRYTLQDDILMGLAYRYNDAPAIGPFTDIAVVRQQFTEGINFAQVLAALHAAHSDLATTPPPPFPLLLEALQPERNLSLAPVIQHGFAFQEAATLPLPSQGRIYASAAINQLDVMLHLRAGEDGIMADWHYDTAIFYPETIERLHQHFEVLLASAAANPTSPLKQLAMITPAEREMIAITWNATDSPVPDNDFVYRLFEKQAARTPNAIAARQPGAEITYDALNRRANRMAHYLREGGIQADTVVAILADRDIDYQATMLAINKAGGAFLPLSPAYPPKRLAAIFERCETPLILISANYAAMTQEALSHMAEDNRPSVQLITDVLGQDYPEENLPPTCEMEHLAYMMFTSGSTGEPKGVMVQHIGMINHNYAKLGDLEMGPTDILAQTSRQSFDIVVWQFLAPLINGGSIYIMPDDIALDPAQLLIESDRHGITVMQLVPVNIEALLDVATAMREAPALKKLRWMVPTGDALHTDLCRRWLNLYPHTRMLNTYGATECSDDQCHYVIDQPPSDEYRPSVMTIGRPIINTQVYILDDAMQIVPVGVVGELYIAGIGVGRGYLKDPERTAKTFIPNPFSADPNAKLYRSGDQSRYLPDGTVEFLGRIGHMIKLRGMRLEPGEIQTALVRHPNVAQATLKVHDFPGIGAHLIAYVVFRNGAVAEDDLRTYLRQSLPDYMIPSYFVELKALPLNANGKIDSKALPIPEIAQTKAASVAPRNETEATLLDIWRKVLNREDFGVYDNFFEMGGYSLLAMRLFSQIERQFGKRLPLATIFRATTIADQALMLSDDPSQKHEFSDLLCVVPIHKGNPKRPNFFCIHAQGGHIIYFHDLARHLGEDQPFYGIQAYGIDGNHEPLNRFEDIAAIYIKEIRSIQPEGPYYIGGECLGGTLAFETVRQLEEQGQEVKLLVMFDSYCAGIPTLKPGVPMWLYEVMFNVKRSRKLYFSQLGSTPWHQMPRQLMDIGERTWLTVRRIFLSRWLAKTNFSDPLNLVNATLGEAEHAYKPQVIKTPITLFNSDLPWGVTDDETLGWTGHSDGGVIVNRFPVMFDTLIEGPGVKLAAERLREILDDYAAQEGK